MLQTVHDDAVVDLVREDDEVVLARDVDELLQHLARVERAGGVVRIDDDEGTSTSSPLSSSASMLRLMSSLTPLPVYTSSMSTPWMCLSCAYCMMALRAENRPFADE